MSCTCCLHALLPWKRLCNQSRLEAVVQHWITICRSQLSCLNNRLQSILHCKEAPITRLLMFSPASHSYQLISSAFCPPSQASLCCTITTLPLLLAIEYYCTACNDCKTVNTQCQLQWARMNDIACSPLHNNATIDGNAMQCRPPDPTNIDTDPE